jgi:membrane-associated phospholipid phosphatase
MIKLKLSILSIFFQAVLFSQSTDFSMLKSIHDSYTPTGGAVFKGISGSMWPLSLGVPVGLYAASKLKKDKEMEWKSYTIGTSLFCTAGATAVLKWTIDRPRPFVAYPTDFTAKVPAGDHSFPSGHTSMAFGLATSLSLSYPKWYIIVPSYTWAVANAYSRMYLGVHYPSDVLAGACLGVGTSVVCHYGMKWIRKRWFSDKADLSYHMLNEF